MNLQRILYMLFFGVVLLVAVLFVFVNYQDEMDKKHESEMTEGNEKVVVVRSGIDHDHVRIFRCQIGEDSIKARLVLNYDEYKEHELTIFVNAIQNDRSKRVRKVLSENERIEINDSVLTTYEFAFENPLKTKQVSVSYELN